MFVITYTGASQINENTLSWAAPRKRTIMKHLQFLLLVFLAASSCKSQNQAPSPYLVGGPCEGCEAVLEYGERPISPTDTLPDFHQSAPRIKIEGTIYQSDGITPASGVTLYVYHTNQAGIYAPKKDATGWGKKHGYNRAWLKTGKDGHYAFYTIKPAPYPSRAEAAHIHYILLEPNGKYYWLESCYFEGAPLLTANEINPEAPRGGTSGLLQLRVEDGFLTGARDIILGKHIPGYE